MRTFAKHADPVLAPAYIYVVLVALLPVSAIIDLIVAPAIYWQNLYRVPMMAVIFVGYMVYLSHKTGPFFEAPLWARVTRLIAECMLLYLLTSNCLPLFDQMVKINAFPLADPWLARADQIIGFDWLAYFEYVHDRAFLIWVFDHAYNVTGQLAFVLTLTLIALGHYKRIQFHMEAVVCTTLICIVVSTITPAYAAAVYYGIDFGEYPNFSFAPGVYHIESLIALREASPDYRIAENPFKGLVTFPSIHTAMGVIMAGAVWRHWMFWPFALYAAVMVASTPVMGSHYVIDLIAGAAVSIGVMMILARRKRYAGVFASHRKASIATVPAE